MPPAVRHRLGISCLLREGRLALRAGMEDQAAAEAEMEVMAEAVEEEHSKPAAQVELTAAVAAAEQTAMEKSREAPEGNTEELEERVVGGYILQILCQVPTENLGRTQSGWG